MYQWAYDKLYLGCGVPQAVVPWRWSAEGTGLVLYLLIGFLPMLFPPQISENSCYVFHKIGFGSGRDLSDSNNKEAGWHVFYVLTAKVIVAITGDHT